MRGIFAALMLVPVLAAAQPFRAEPQRHSAPAAAPAPKGAAFAADPNYDPQRERCRNFQRELRGIERSQREAGITGERTASNSRRLQVEQQAIKAGCSI